MYAAIAAARTLGKDNYRQSARQPFLCRFHCQTGSRRRGIIDIYMTRHTATITHQRYFFETFFHHPPEIMAQISVDSEYVVCALMIGNEYIRSATADIIAPRNLHSDESQPAEMRAQMQPGQ